MNPGRWKPNETVLTPRMIATSAVEIAVWGPRFLFVHWFEELWGVRFRF